MMLRVAAAAMSAAFLAAFPAAPAAAQEDKYPVRPVTVIVPFAAGGALDVAVRLIEPKVTAALGQPLVISNRVGAGGAIGAAAAAKAAPDGYTLVGINSSTINLVRLTNKDVPYGYRDFVAAGNFAVDVAAIMVAPDSRWKTLADLLADAKATPGKLTFGSTGGGGLTSMLIGAVKQERDLDMVDVPFQSSAAVILAVIGKQVDFGSVLLSSAMSMAADNKVRILAIATPQRLTGLPDVPTFEEYGIRNASLPIKAGLYAPAGTPPKIVETLSNAIGKAMADKSVTDALEKTGLFAIHDAAAAAQAFIAKDSEVVSQLGEKLAVKP